MSNTSNNENGWDASESLVLAASIISVLDGKITSTPVLKGYEFRVFRYLPKHFVWYLKNLWPDRYFMGKFFRTFESPTRK